MWEAWEKREESRMKARLESGGSAGRDGEASGKAKGKRPSQADVLEDHEGGEKEESLVLFACRHLWHRGCLESESSAVGQEQSAEGGNAEVGKMMGRVGLKCPLC